MQLQVYTAWLHNPSVLTPLLYPEEPWPGPHNAMLSSCTCWDWLSHKPYRREQGPLLCPTSLMDFLLGSHISVLEPVDTVSNASQSFYTPAALASPPQTLSVTENSVTSRLAALCPCGLWTGVKLCDFLHSALRILKYCLLAFRSQDFSHTYSNFQNLWKNLRFY